MLNFYVWQFYKTIYDSGFKIYEIVETRQCLVFCAERENLMGIANFFVKLFQKRVERIVKSVPAEISK